MPASAQAHVGVHLRHREGNDAQGGTNQLGLAGHCQTAAGSQVEQQHVRPQCRQLFQCLGPGTLPSHVQTAMENQAAHQCLAIQPDMAGDVDPRRAAVGPGYGSSGIAASARV